MRILIIATLMTTAFAGCAGNDGLPSARFEFAVLDVPIDLEMEVSGVWLQKQDNGTWSRAVAVGSALAPESNTTSMPVAPGPYERLRIVFANISQGGAAARLAENGFDLPINISLGAGDTVRVSVGFSWPDTLYESSDGLVFQPSVARIEVVRNGEPVLRLAAREIDAAGTNPPVARMEIFDAEAARVFQADFVAESPALRVIAAGPNITFQAATSEAVQRGATLDSFAWDFGDGTTGEGQTVSHVYPLSGGNFTVRLTVTDSFGASDSQTVKMALAPGTFTGKKVLQGTVSHVDPSKAAYVSCIDRLTSMDPVLHSLDADGTQPAGIPSDLVAARINMHGVGNPHAQADLDLRVLDAAGTARGSSGDSGVTEEVRTSLAPGTAAAGAWTAEVWPCTAVQLEYQIVAAFTWLAKEPEPGYLAWLAGYDDGHDHQH